MKNTFAAIALCSLLVHGNAWTSLGAETANSATNLVRQLDTNTFQIGAVRLDTKERSVIIPATVNMVEGPIEYLLVSSIGKLHESIFKTVAEPIHVHTAALLLLTGPVTTNTPPRLRVSVQFNPEKKVP